MTILEYIENYCHERGMFPKDIEGVISNLSNNENFKVRLTDKLTDYPSFMKQLIEIYIDKEAIKYIEENIPLAWFKPLFQEN